MERIVPKLLPKDFVRMRARGCQLPDPVDRRETIQFNSTVRIFPDDSIVVKRSVQTKLAGFERRPSEGVTDESVLIKNHCWRAKQDIFDLARANSWDYFVTMTLDGAKVDRYNYDEVVPKLQTFTKFLRRHGCQYLIVPELHKDGAFHFHGLVQGVLEMKYRETKYNKQGEPYDCFSIVGYNLGRSDISLVRDQARVSSYMTKYVTKELLQTVPKGKKRYWASRGLARPQIERAEFTDDELSSMAASAQYICTYADPSGNDIVTVVL